MDRYQSNQGDQSDNNSSMSELPEHINPPSAKDDVQAGEVLIVEDDTDKNNTLEKDMEEQRRKKRTLNASEGFGLDGRN